MTELEKTSYLLGHKDGSEMGFKKGYEAGFEHGIKEGAKELIRQNADALGLSGLLDKD